MIILTKLDGTEFALNSDLIESIEAKPDTTIKLVTKNYHIVLEQADDIIKKITEFKRQCNQLPTIY